MASDVDGLLRVVTTLLPTDHGSSWNNMDWRNLVPTAELASSFIQKYLRLSKKSCVF